MFIVIYKQLFGKSPSELSYVNNSYCPCVIEFIDEFIS